MPGTYLKQELYKRVQTDPVIFDFIQQAALDGLWYWDLVDGAAEWMSPEFKALFGYEDHEIANSSTWWQENIHPDDLGNVLENFEAHKSNPDHPYDQIVRYRHKDGSIVWVRCRGLIIRDESGTPVRMIGAHTDVTALKRKEHELALAKEAAETAANVKSNFLENMSHEIRTPLTGVIGMLELLELSELTGTQAEQIGVAKWSAKTLLAIINQMFDLTKIKAGSFKLSPEAFDGSSVFGQAAAIMESKATAKGLKFEAKIKPSACRYFSGDAERITQIIYNLLGNAIKFTDKGSIKLWISAQDAEDDDKLELIIKVTDTGIGIAPEDQERIFNRFQQLDEEDDRSFQGAGLGLSIISEISHFMDGDISVESEVGVGSVFTCRLVLDACESVQAVSAANDVKVMDDAGDYHLLVAEDNPVNQRMISSFLDILGFKFDIVADGLDAVEACQATRYDLVLMDLQMPQLDGVRAASRIRDLGGHYANVPIIAVTANVFSEDIRRCRESGMNDHIGKPYTLEQLRGLAQRYLAKSSDVVH